MRLRSAQFVLLVLLFSSLGLSERSSLSLADELIGSGNGILLSQQAARTPPFANRPHATAPLQLARQGLRSAHQQILTQAWTMPQPAAQAATIQATTANARA